MKTSIKSNEILSQAGFGVTGALLTGAFAICMCAVTGQGLLSFLLCCVVCFIFSIKNKDGVFTPHPFFLLPLFFSFSAGSTLITSISIVGGALIFLCISKLLKKHQIPDYIVSGVGLGLTVAVTILLTNSYFGIGATTFYPLEMLKEFKSLGFHPNFRGLFYGTITLFAMITVPFKFKKLNQYIPAAFITLLIPYIFNLFLNPVREMTTINESTSLIFANSLKDEFSLAFDITTDNIPILIRSSLSFGAIFYLFDKSEIKTCPANCVSGILTGIPVKKHPIKNYGIVSAITSVTIIALLTLLCPDIFSRIPLHCAGSMLIVAAWQSLPKDSLKNVFKERNIIKIILMVICAVPFVLTNVFTAILICFVLWAITDKFFGKACAK